MLKMCKFNFYMEIKLEGVTEFVHILLLFIL